MQGDFGKAGKSRSCNGAFDSLSATGETNISAEELMSSAVELKSSTLYGNFLTTLLVAAYINLNAVVFVKKIKPYLA